MKAPALEFAATFAVDVGIPCDIGPTPSGHRRLIPILGGTVTGPLLRGVVLPGGADDQVLLEAQVQELEATYALRLDDGSLVRVRNHGVRSGSAEDLERLAAGEHVSPERIYFRTAPRLSASAPHLDWLNRTLFLATGERGPGQVLLQVYAVR